MTILLKNLLTIVLTFIAGIGLCEKYAYKPSVGDKFQYKISNGGKYFPATFIYDLKEKLPVFHWKWGNEDPVWGSWNEPANTTTNIINNLRDSVLIKNTNLLFVNSAIYKQIKSGKNFKLNIHGRELEFKCGTPADYELPIMGAGLKFKILTASANDNKLIINILDNPCFPLITALLDDISWQLEKIVPMPMLPITHDIVGFKLEDKNAGMFNNYIKETCIKVEIDFTEKFRKLEFNEYFCPTVGVRFSLKNDTIVSLQLLSSSSNLYGYSWQTYLGNVWGLYGLGAKRQSIENHFGKPIVTNDGKLYYPDRKFYLVYNSEGKLEEVDYE